MKKHAVWKRSCALVLIGFMLLSGCGTCARAEVPELLEPQKAFADTAAVIRAQLDTVSIYDGYIAARAVECAFDVSGTVREICVYNGQYVRAGDLLMRMDTENTQRQIQEMEKQAERLQKLGEYEDEIALINIRIQEAEAQKIKDPQALQLARLEIEASMLELEHARELRALQLDRIQSRLSELNELTSRQVLTAPCDGFVRLRQTVQENTYVQAFREVMWVLDTNDLYVSVPQLIASQLLQRARLYALIGDTRYPVIAVEADWTKRIAAALTGQTVYTEFAFTGEVGPLAAGDYAAILAETGREEAVLQVPSGAVYTAGGSAYVYVQTQQGKERRNVKIGRSNGIMTEITEGLAEGETVYVKD